MTETLSHNENETPIDKVLFNSICEEIGRGIRTRVLNVLGISYGITDEGLKRLWNESTTEERMHIRKGNLTWETHKSSTPLVKNIGHKSLEAVGKYLKEKGLL